MVRLIKKDRLNNKSESKYYIKEGKQVGSLYHVCTLDAFSLKIIPKDRLEASGDFTNDLLNTNQAISFTRDSSFVVSTPRVLNADILFQIVVDGDKLSDRYKITPYQDVKFTFNDSRRREREEVVIGPIKNFKSYIREVHFDIKDLELLTDKTVKQYLYRLKRIQKYLGSIKCTRAYLPYQQFFGFNFTYNKKVSNHKFNINTLDDLISFIENKSSENLSSKDLSSLIDTPDILIKYIDRLDEEDIISIIDKYPNFASSIPLTGVTKATNFSLVKQILQRSKFSNINRQDNDGHTILFSYCMEGSHVDIIKYLVDNGADPNIKDKRGNTPLSYVCHNYDLSDNDTLEVVKLFIEHGADVKIKYDMLYSCLSYSLDYDKVNTAIFLIEHGADPNSKVLSFGASALYYACSDIGNIELIKVLLDHGADPNIPYHQYDGTTYYCLDTCFNSAVKIKNYNITLSSSTKETIVKLLLEYGANPNVKDRHYLYKSISYDLNTSLEALLEHGADPNVKKYNPLFWACDGNDIEAILLLLEHGANPNLSIECTTTSGNNTILNELVSRDSRFDKTKIDVFKLLLEHGAIKTLNTPDSKGFTPLYYVCKRNQIQRIRLFLKYGADVKLLGDNPLNISKDSRVNDILKKYI